MEQIEELLELIEKTKHIVENLQLISELETVKEENTRLRNEIKQKTDDMSNLTKVSMIQSINKQLNEKNNYITILEGQLEKLKNIKPKVETITEKPKEQVMKAFDPDNFEEINGYELICYKKKYYLRDLETNELYDIDNNMPNKVVGLISSSGKAKLK